MKGLGRILAVLGIIVIIVGLVNHFAVHFLGSMKGGSTIILIVGVVLLVIGAVLYLLPRKASA
ncbi:MAG TPA: hypothetical protein VKQ30_10505 [Ktedonobacterales bacterium]|nr:hypothetical protein [Ktedonobacterales bacterium]